MAVTIYGASDDLVEEPSSRLSMPDSCPALWILRGAMGVDRDGHPIEPRCRPDASGRCGHCNSTTATHTTPKEG